MSRYAALLLVSLSLGCATHADRLCEVRASYFMGNTEAAAAKIDAALPKFPREADAFKLDRGIVLLSEGRAKEAEALFREVRDNFDHLEQKDLAEGAWSMLTDDQRLAYAGEDYEKVLIRVFLSLANLMGDGQDAGAYALQVADKQRQIIETGKAADDKNPKEQYKQVAAGAYLLGALREETHQNYDDAARCIEQVCAWAPEFASGKRDLERVKQGQHSQKGNGVLYVFALVGRGPFKEERMEVPTTVALLVADRIVSHNANRSLPPTVAPIKVPKVIVPPNEVQAVSVGVDGQGCGQTETLTDVGRMAKEQSETLAPYVLGRAIARRFIKKGAIYGAKELLDVQKGNVASLALDVAGVVWEATEQADTRCWGLLPEKVQVLRVELPAGQHTLSLEPVGALGARPYSATVEIADGRNTYVLASFPTARLAGQIVSSRPGK